MSGQEEKISEKPKEMSAQLTVFYRDAIKNIHFSKQQEWRVTNYVLIGLAVIFAINKEINPAKLWEIIVLAVLTTVAAGLGFFYLLSLKKFAQKMRRRVSSIYTEYFSDAEKIIFNIDPERALKGDDPGIGYTLMGVIYVGAIVVLHFLARSA